VNKLVTVIDITPILRTHFSILKKELHLWPLLFLFVFIPFAVSITLIYFDFLISNNLINVIITTFAILVGFIINVLVILLNYKKEGIRIRDQLVEHLSYNCLYELILGLTLLAVALLLSILNGSSVITLLSLLSFIIYFLIINFLITLLMISKRLFTLFFNKFNS